MASEASTAPPFDVTLWGRDVTTHPIDVLLFTAKSSERLALTKFFSRTHKECTTVMIATKFPCDLVPLQSGHLIGVVGNDFQGPTSFLGFAMQVLDEVRPAFAAMVGICAGQEVRCASVSKSFIQLMLIDPHECHASPWIALTVRCLSLSSVQNLMKINDVAIGVAAYEADSGRQTAGQFEVAIHHEKVDNLAVNSKIDDIVQLNRATAKKVTMVTSIKVREDLQAGDWEAYRGGAYRGIPAIALDMEAAVMLQACRLTKTQALGVYKGVLDFGTVSSRPKPEKKPDSVDKCVWAAAAIVMDVVQGLLPAALDKTGVHPAMHRGEMAPTLHTWFQTGVSPFARRYQSRILRCFLQLPGSCPCWRRK